MDGIRNNIAINDKGIHSNTKLNRTVMKTINGVDFYDARVSTGSANKNYTYNATTNWIKHENSEGTEGFMIYYNVTVLANKAFNCFVKSYSSNDPIDDIETFFNNNKSLFVGSTVWSRIQLGDDLHIVRSTSRLNKSVTDSLIHKYIYYVIVVEDEYLASLVINPV